MHQGVLNGEAWSNNGMQGPRWLEGAEKKQALRAANFNALANWQNVYSSLQTQAEEEVEGKPAYKVAATLKDGDKPEILWFDKQSGLLVKNQMTLATPQGEIPLEMWFRNYRKAGAVQMAYELEQKIGPQTIKTTVETIDFNKEIEPERFAVPAEVQALSATKKP